MAEDTIVKSANDAADKSQSDTALVRLLRRFVGRIEAGSLSLELPSGRQVTLGGERSGRNAHIAVHRWRALARVGFSGDIGFAEALADGDCSSRDLKTLLLWAMDNSGAHGTVGDGLRPSQFMSRLRHALHANTKRNSRSNIAAHYDLGNAFYGAWLDAGLNYSSGIYPNPDMSLDTAQLSKNERIAELLDVRGGESVLEIGCGWGALAQHLATQHSCKITGLTLSAEQLAYARDRLSGTNANILLQDYRDATGSFDRIASIEMIEAVGENFWSAYFGKIAACLKRDGTAVLQAITIDEGRYAAYRRRPDFIQLCIFPGGMLPTKSIIAAEARRAGLCVTQSQYFGLSYARTLAEWRTRFDRAWPTIKDLGFDERFRRLWDYYLVYCEAGFEAGWVDVGLYQIRHQ
jgi:cyclopropane-fatty-acyl-phospholipid synthase